MTRRLSRDVKTHGPPAPTSHQCQRRAKSEAAHTDREKVGGDEVLVREIGNNCGVDAGFHFGETEKTP